MGLEAPDVFTGLGSRTLQLVEIGKMRNVGFVGAPVAARGTKLSDSSPCLLPRLWGELVP